MDFQYLCHQLLKLHNEIFIVTVLRGMKVVAQATKNGVPTPNSEELEKMYLQGWTMLTQVSTNEPLYGKVEYITISHEKMKGLLAPIDDKHYIGIGCAKPCNAEDIIRNAKRILIGEVNA